MLTDTEKNVAIASMELCVQDARRLAGVPSLATIERFIAQVRAMFTADDESVTDAHIKLAWDMLAAVETLPSRGNISRLRRRIAPAGLTSTPPSPPITSGTFDGSAVFDGTTTFGAIS